MLTVPSLLLRDALIVSVTNSFTSILAGFVVFSAIGYMSHIHNLPVDNISTDGKLVDRLTSPNKIVTVRFIGISLTFYTLASAESQLETFPPGAGG